MHFVYVAMLGWLLSFLGQLPLGTMSITATQIAVQENFRNAWVYSIGVALVEVIYLRCVLFGVHWIMQHQVFFAILGWLTVVLFLILGTISFLSARKQQGEQKAVLLNNKFNRFALGLTMSTLNPAQIPFWFIWTSYFLDLHWLQPSAEQFNTFAFGAGLGTVSGLVVYMYGGNWLVTKMKTSTKSLNTFMGIIFVVAALAQLWRMMHKSGSAL